MSAPLRPAPRTRMRTWPAPGSGSGWSAMVRDPSSIVTARMTQEYGRSPMTLPVDGYQLKDISPKAYEHPADRAASAALGSVPMRDAVVRKLIELGYERALRQAYLGGSVRIGP